MNGPAGVPGPELPPIRPPAGPAEPRAGRSRGRHGVLLAGLVLGLAGLAISAVGIAHQFMPRTFSAAQRQQIMSWEVGKRWRSWRAGQIFPAAVTYSLPGAAFGGGSALSLAAHRVGIAHQAGCGPTATDPATARALARQGCLAVLRATYTDQTQSLAVTVGVAVLPSARAARQSSQALTGGRRAPLVRAVHFRRTAAAAFSGRSGRVAWERVSGPYLVLAAAGYADGRPWQATGDFYTKTEMLSLAGGVGRTVAAGLGAAPVPPHCPGSPAC